MSRQHNKAVSLPVPDSKISGGQVLSSRTRPTRNRAALALRVAARALHRSDSFLDDYFRRMQARMCTPKATTPAAHKLAPIIDHLVTKQPCDTTSCRIRIWPVR
jgi:hypothetical protein